MWQRLQAVVRDWFILIIGVLVIVPGFYVASLPSPSLPAASSAPLPAQPDNSSHSPPAAQNAQPNGAPGQSAATQRSGQTAQHTSSAAPAATRTAAESHTHAAVAPAPLPQTSTPAVAATGTPAAITGGDSVAGRQVFRKCQACHSLSPGKNLVGPSLAGIIGRKSGTAPNYSYSPAMKQANIVWDAKSLDAYLSDPQKVVPGNKMPFPGLKTAHDRTDVIAYLASVGRGAPTAAATAQRPSTPAPSAQPAPAAQASQNAPSPPAVYIPDARYTLRSGIAEGRMVFIGVGGSIDGKVNPVLTAAEGQVVQLTLINGEGAEHDIVFPDQDARTPRVTGKGASTTSRFAPASPATLFIFAACPGTGSPNESIPGYPNSTARRCRGRSLTRANRLARSNREA